MTLERLRRVVRVTVVRKLCIAEHARYAALLLDESTAATVCSAWRLGSGDTTCQGHRTCSDTDVDDEDEHRTSCSHGEGSLEHHFLGCWAHRSRGALSGSLARACWSNQAPAQP